MAHCLVWPNATIVPPWSHRHPTSFEGRSALSCFTRGLVFLLCRVDILVADGTLECTKSFLGGLPLLLHMYLLLE